MKIGSLCTGYGGLDLAVEAFYNAETVWTCEYDKYASKVIKARISQTNHGDLKTTDWTQVEPIDILTAGYPCQPFSHAGLRKGVEDERHLWPYIKEIIGILRPRFVVLENVRGHFGLGFREVLSDLTSIGYDARWRLIRASDVGAPHSRERLFILAYPSSSGSRQQFTISTPFLEHRDTRSGPTSDSNGTGLQRPVGSRYGFNKGANAFNDTNSLRKDCKSRDEIISDSNDIRGIRCMPGLESRYDSRGTMHLQEVPAPLDKGKLNAKFVEYLMGLPAGWVTDVDISRSQQLKILGNGVVPQQAYKALEILNSYPQKLSTGYPHA